MILGLKGQTSVGKSTLFYTGPLPLVAFAFDSGANRAVFGSMSDKLFKGIDIEVVQYPPPTLVDMEAEIKFWTRNSDKCITVYLLPEPLQFSTMIQGCEQLWNTFTLRCNLALQRKEIVTVGVDTMTIARRVAANAHLQDLQKKDPNRKQLLQVEWGRPGDMVRTIYTTAQNQSEAFAYSGGGKNFIVTHHMTEQRVNEKVITDAQGNPLWQMEGLHNTVRFLDVELEMTKGVIKTPNPFGGKAKEEIGIFGTFTKCGYDISLEGTRIENPTWDSLAKLLNTKLHDKAKIMLRDMED